MQVAIKHIPVREVLHFLGWRGAPVDSQLMEEIASLSEAVIKDIQPRFILKRFLIDGEGRLEHTRFFPAGKDVGRMLASCREAVLLAATLGVQSERMLLRTQARSAAQALILDAVLSAAIEAACDQAEDKLRARLAAEGMHLTDRFSPGYGDMPLAQTEEICEILNTEKTIGLTVSKSGIMIPRKSVTAIMGISSEPVARRARGCAGCAMRGSCALAQREA